MTIINVKEEDISQAYFDATDLKRTLNSYTSIDDNGKEVNTKDLKRIHGGTDNEDTVGDLIDNILWHIENMYEQIEEEKAGG